MVLNEKSANFFNAFLADFEFGTGVVHTSPSNDEARKLRCCESNLSDESGYILLEMCHVATINISTTW
jgi:hypothetical protein